MARSVEAPQVRVGYLLILLFFAHFVAFNTWWMLGPFGPRAFWNIKGGLGGDLAFYPVFGLTGPLIGLLAAWGLVGTVGKEPLGKRVHRGFEAISWCSTLNFFFFLIAAGRVLDAPERPHDHMLDVLAGTHGTAPLTGRFLSFHEIALVGLCAGLLVFYLTFYFREKPLVASGAGWTAFRLVATNAAIYAAFAAASVVICVCITAVFQVIARLMSMSLVATADSMFKEVARETGPGLSRSVPYGFTLMVWFILSLAGAVYCMLILPYKLASVVLDGLIRQLGQEQGMDF